MKSIRGTVFTDIIDALVLGTVIYAGITDNIGLAVAGIGVYLLGDHIDKMRGRLDAQPAS